MENAADSIPVADAVPPAKRVFFPGWLAYVVAACLMALGLVQTLRVIQLKKDLGAARQNLATAQAQKIEDAARKNLAELRLTLLPAKDPAYTAAAVAVAWDPALNEGVVTLQNLPAPAAGHDYQLWVLDPKALAPLNAGVINIAAPTSHFAASPVSVSGPGFAVSLEMSGGVPAPIGPILFAVAPQE